MCSITGRGVEEGLGAVDATLSTLADLLGHGSHAAADTVSDLTHDQLRGLVGDLTRLQARTQALLLSAVGEVDARGSYALDGALTAGAWLRATTRATPAAAAGTVRTARALRTGTLPHTTAALAAGAITARHAQLIADATIGAPAEAVALIEPEAVALASEADLRATAHLMRAFTEALDPDAADEAAVRRYDRAGITLSPTLGGSFVIAGAADETTGATLAAAIDAASPLVRGDTRTPARRRLDGLTDIARHWLHTRPSDQPDPGDRSTGRYRTQLVVTLDAASLTTPGPGAAEQPTIPAAPVGSAGGTLSWAGPVTAATARRLGCDSLATFLTLGPDGSVIEAGTQRRFFTTAQRRAMIGRDGHTCAAPYCDRPVIWSDAHHLVPVEDGGPTTVANGALPCEAHHLVLHEGHWQLRRLPDSRYQLHHSRTGRTLGPEPDPAGRTRPPLHRRE